MREHLKWIDVAKATAIFAVILDHTFGLVYTNELFHLHTVFSVTLFVFLGGITAGISISNQKSIDRSYVIKKVLNLIAPYILITFVAVVYYNNWILDIHTFFTALLSFTALPPLYFVLFYAQLIICSPFLYRVISKCNKNIRKEGLALFVIYLLSWWLTHKTLISNIYGGGGRLLGGSYLFVYFLGMLFQRHMDSLKNKRLNTIAFAGTILLLAVMEVTFVNKIWANPPTKYTILYSLCIFMLIFTISNIVTVKSRILTALIDVIAYIGKNTLYIFMYHWLFLDIGKSCLVALQIQNKYLIAIWAVSWCLIPPILVSFIVKKAKKPLKQLLFE